MALLVFAMVNVLPPASAAPASATYYRDQYLVGCYGPLDGKGRTTTTGGCSIRIANDELSALQIFRVIHLGSHQILETEWVDQQGDAVIINGDIVLGLFFIKRKSVLKPGTAAATDIDAQFQLWIPFLQDEFLDFTRSSVGEIYRGWYGSRMLFHDGQE